jgi:hypothetical protein
VAKLLSQRISAAALALLGFAFGGGLQPAHARTVVTGSAPIPIVKFRTLPMIKLSVTPNYNTGFGAVRATTGAQGAAVAGPAASLDGGAVDFGTVVSGSAYLYKYAAHLHVTSNAANFALYAEATANFTQTTDSGTPPSSSTGVTLPINQTLFYLASGATSDSNTGYSASRPFQAGTGAFNSPTLGDNGETFAPIYTGAINAAADLYYDYQLRTEPTVSGGYYFVYVVYTVVPM